MWTKEDRGLPDFLNDPPSYIPSGLRWRLDQWPLAGNLNKNSWMIWPQTNAVRHTKLTRPAPADRCGWPPLPAASLRSDTNANASRSALQCRIARIARLGSRSGSIPTPARPWPTDNPLSRVVNRTRISQKGYNRLGRVRVTCRKIRCPSQCGAL